MANSLYFRRGIKSVKSLSVLLLLTVTVANAQSVDSRLFAGLHWRMIGPLRGGRTRATAGVASQPGIFYVGAVNGGIWKTNDYGRTWAPVFDSQPTGSIGALAVAPSDPNIVYAGSGEGLHRPDLSTGDGIYKSTDAGATWTHLGLRDGQQIPQICVDPHNPNRLFVAVLGHPYGPNSERGIYRSTDGGLTFQKVLYKDENTGGNGVDIDPANPSIVYATMWEGRLGPWENSDWNGTGGGIFKSTDGGDTWHPLTHGLPSVIQANVVIAPTEPNRLYATVANKDGVGIYRSDDAGENWRKTTDDPRPANRIGGGDAPVPAVDPKNPDVLYIASTVTWKSSDGGKTWMGIRGAPGGDDYQHIWINPNDPAVILLASDQGAVVTVNGGQTWSSWYNQPTAQMYHASADNAFPYRVCGGQQESGSACVASRGNDGAITFRDWHPVGAEEYGYVAPDPLNPDLVYGGKLTRYDRRTGQVQNVSPKPVNAGDFRTVRTAPVLFSPIDPRVLYFAGNTLWKTGDGGDHWKQISPDLTRKTWTAPVSVGKYVDQPTAKPTQRGVIYAVAPSPLDINRIWAGTDDGLLHMTVDGGAHWKDVTPPGVVAWQKISILDAGHFDPQTCYAAINAFRLDDLHPHIFRTHDGGKTWTEIANGIPEGAAVNVVREDPKRKGLLYAGTEREVYVSLDDGDRWQSMRLNSPATSIRDLIVKDDDLIAATHGRGFWILDNVTPLRQIKSGLADAPAFLFAPQTAVRVRWNMNTDTPLPPDEPSAANPPSGAIIDYWLGPSASGPVSLEIQDSAGQVVRSFSSTDRPEKTEPMLAIPAYWLSAPRVLASDPGMHRFLWDMHYAPLPREAHAEYPIAAVPHETEPAANSPWVMPGAYAVKLTVNGRTYSQPLNIKMDPRVSTPREGLLAQFTLSKQIYDDLPAVQKALEEIREAVPRLGKKAEALVGAPPRRFAAPGPDSLTSVNASLEGLMQILQDSDTAPTSQVVAAVADQRRSLSELMARWKALQQDKK